MTRSFFRHFALIAFIWALGISIAPPSHAQDNAGATQRIRGEVRRIDGDMLFLRGSNGQPVTVLLPRDATVTSVKPAKLTDIKPGRFVGATARPKAGGRWQAVEVHIFPVGTRPDEGHHPWAPEPGATITNADVTAAAIKTNEGDMTLATGGQTYEFNIPKGTPIVAMDPGTRTLIGKGAHVVIGQAQQGAGGAYTTKAIIVTTVPNWPPQ